MARSKISSGVCTLVVSVLLCANEPHPKEKARITDKKVEHLHFFILYSFPLACQKSLYPFIRIYG